MSASLLRARSSLIRSSSIASTSRLLHRNSHAVASSSYLRAISSLHHQPLHHQPLHHQPQNCRSMNTANTTAVVYCNASTGHRTAASSRRIYSTTTSMQKSAMPLPSIDDDTPTPSNDSSTTSTPFLLADIGEGISEVELLQWYVTPGDTISQFDRVCEVQSDKASVEITSRFDGVVEQLCGEVGDMMFVGKPLMYIATEGGVGVGGGGEQLQETAQDSMMTPQPMATLNNVDDEQDRLRIPSVGSNFSSYYDEDDVKIEASIIESSHAGTTTKVLTSPAVRKLGKENDIDLTTVLGTGPGGRILKADVLKIIGGTTAISPSSAQATSNTSAKLPPISSPSISEDTTIPLRGYNRLMVKSMTSSLSIPHMVYADEVNVNSLTSIRDSLRPLAKQMGVEKLTYMPFFVKAASLAMNEYPVLNSTIDVESMTLTYHAEHNVGIAVDTERGLAVPVVRGCQEKSVLDIALELGRLYSLAAVGNLSEEDIANPTFTLSNIGAIGGTYMSPVVLPPQVAIGAMGKIQRLPRFVDDESDKVESVRIMPMSWGGDHRAVDGATMARFSNLWKSYVENPSLMMFAMS